MLNLKVQSANKPRNKPVLRCKISCGLYLVNGPLIRHFLIVARSWKFGVLHSMRQLEHNAEDEAGNQCADEKAYQPRYKTCKINRQRYEQEVMHQLKAPENKMIVHAHVLQWHGPYSSFKIFLVIQHKHPHYVDHRLKEP